MCPAPMRCRIPVVVVGPSIVQSDRSDAVPRSALLREATGGARPCDWAGRLARPRARGDGGKRHAGDCLRCRVRAGGGLGHRIGRRSLAARHQSGQSLAHCGATRGFRRRRHICRRPPLRPAGQRPAHLEHRDADCRDGLRVARRSRTHRLRRQPARAGWGGERLQGLAHTVRHAGRVRVALRCPARERRVRHRDHRSVAARRKHRGGKLGRKAESPAGYVVRVAWRDVVRPRDERREGDAGGRSRRHPLRGRCPSSRSARTSRSR